MEITGLTKARNVILAITPRETHVVMISVNLKEVLHAGT